MSRPRQEGDLSGIIQRVNNLRRQQGLADQTATEYRTAITNHRNGLLAICSQPDVQIILAKERDAEVQMTIEQQQAQNRLYEKGIIILTSFPPRLGNILSSYNEHGSKTDFSTRAEPKNQLYNQRYLLLLDVKEIARGKFDFFLEFESADFPQSVDPNTITFFGVNNFGPTPGTKIAAGLNDVLSLDPSTKWQRREVMPNASRLHDGVRFNKRVTTEDFLRHPEWLERFDTALTTSLDRAHAQTDSRMKEQQRRTAQFASPPIEQVVADLHNHTREYSPVALLLVAQNAAGTALERTSPLPAEVYEVVKSLIAQMIEERLATLQQPPQIQKTASSSNETVMERFVKRSRDPKRMTDLLLKLSSLVPGVQQTVTILEAVNIMFGPEEQTK